MGGEPVTRLLNRIESIPHLWVRGGTDLTARELAHAARAYGSGQPYEPFVSAFVDVLDGVSAEVRAAYLQVVIGHNRAYWRGRAKVSPSRAILATACDGVRLGATASGSNGAVRGRAVRRGSC